MPGIWKPNEKYRNRNHWFKTRYKLFVFRQRFDRCFFVFLILREAYTFALLWFFSSFFSFAILSLTRTFLSLGVKKNDWLKNWWENVLPLKSMTLVLLDSHSKNKRKDRKLVCYSFCDSFFDTARNNSQSCLRLILWRQRTHKEVNEGSFLLWLLQLSSMATMYIKCRKFDYRA